MYKGSNFKSELEFTLIYGFVAFFYEKKDPFYLNTEPNSTLL